MQLLNDMELFMEVGKAMSFRGASAAIGVPIATLSRRISRLEKHIGLRLFNRTTRKVELTEAGQAYFERCKRIVEDARLAHEQLGEMLARPNGVLRASLPVDLAVDFLAPLISQFARDYPEIRFELDLTPRRVDLASDPVDVAIRMGPQPDSNLIARQIASLPCGLYASPRYLERNGVPAHPDELAVHECLRMSAASNGGAWALRRGDAVATMAVSGRFSLNSVGMIRRLAGLGMGIARLPSLLVAADLANGTLQRVLPEWTASAVPAYALTQTRLLPAKTQRFIDFLQEHAQRAVDDGEWPPR
ncbi:LysR family transcriptional regulator [Lysobacter enzymogenes]|nr:LysR family transcriptional regulator [Lysobacter enzymogenes]